MNTNNESNNICNDVEKTLEEHRFSREQIENYKKCGNFFKEIKEMGLFEKEKYKVGLLDTIGRKWYKDMQKVWEKHGWDI